MKIINNNNNSERFIKNIIVSTLYLMSLLLTFKLN